MSTLNRFYAEHRGGDNGEKPWEWCVIDEENYLFGCAILFDLEKSDAKQLAEMLNRMTKE